MRPSVRYHFHGIDLGITGPSEVLQALHARLGQFPVVKNAAKSAAMRFDYLAGSSVETPTGASRSVYEPISGQALYFAGTDELYLQYETSVCAVCAPAQGITRISYTSLDGIHLWYATHPFFTLPFIECLKRRGLFNIHAAAVGKRGKTILFAGTSGAGKSTLALALANRGFDLSGDDMQFLRVHGREVRVHAFPEDLDLTQSTRNLFPDMDAMETLEKLEGWPKYRLGLKDLALAMEGRAVALVFPRVSGARDSCLSPMDAGQAFLQLASNVLLTERSSSQAHLSVLSLLTETVNCYSLATGSDFGELAELMDELLK